MSPCDFIQLILLYVYLIRYYFRPNKQIYTPHKDNTPLIYLNKYETSGIQPQIKALNLTK